jgi:ATP-binding cassette subfamily B protein
MHSSELIKTKKCLVFISKYYNKNIEIIDFDIQNNINPTFEDLCKHILFDVKKISIREEDLLKVSKTPILFNDFQGNYLIIKKVTKQKVVIYCPIKGEYEQSKKSFYEDYFINELLEIILLEPSIDFYSEEKGKNKEKSILSLISYLTRFKKYFFQIILGLVASSVILLIIPFLTKAIIDKGILNEDLNFVYIAVGAQFVLYIASLTIDFFRRWFFLHIGSRMEIQLVSEFLEKIFRLPMPFFENSNVSKLLKRIEDHSKLHTVLAVTSLKTISALLTILLLTAVLLIINQTIFFLFTIGSIASMLWVYAFLKKRGRIDNKRFDVTTKEQNKTIEIFEKIQDIKIYNTEAKNSTEWLKYKAKLFKIENSWLTLDQVQELGAEALDRIKGLLIILISAKAVVEGRMTLGELFAVNMVVSQLEKPMKQIITFVKEYFDASVAFKRIMKIKNLEDECPEKQFYVHAIPPYDGISLENISFSYPESSKNKVLNSINLFIPKGKTTAIIGTSGSGKSTLMKLLLKYYKPTEGEIKIGGLNINTIHSSVFRSKIGVVLQEGRMFNESILENIAMDKVIDYDEIIKISKLVCLHDFVVEKLEHGYHTVLGEQYGIHLSKGQEQRVLFARALYSNPEFLFLDEATSALDNKTEKKIVDNLKKLDSEKTLVIIAHRLSTVKDADNIIVIEKGEVAEQGSHYDLIERRGLYFEMIKDQLVLDTEYA